MSFFSAFLFGLSANIDAFVLGLSYGFKRQRFPLALNFVVSFITLAGTLLALFAGSFLAAVFPPYISAMLGSLLLMGLGCYYCLKFLFLFLREKPVCAASHQEGPPVFLSVRETLVLGMALAFNNMGVGIGASFAGLSIPLVGIFTFLLCLLLLLAGNQAGLKWRPGRFSVYGDLLSGGIIFLLGGGQLLSRFFA